VPSVTDESNLDIRLEWCLHEQCVVFGSNSVSSVCCSGLQCDDLTSGPTLHSVQVMIHGDYDDDDDVDVDDVDDDDDDDDDDDIVVHPGVRRPAAMQRHYAVIVVKRSSNRLSIQLRGQA
jgi:hypothetical protein